MSFFAFDICRQDTTNTIVLTDTYLRFHDSLLLVFGSKLSIASMMLVYTVNTCCKIGSRDFLLAMHLRLATEALIRLMM